MRAIVLSAVALAATPLAADISFPSFASTAGLTLLGNGPFQNGNELRLTAAQEGRSAAVWFGTKQAVAPGFTTEFRFRITEPGGVPDFFGFLGADGLALVIQNFDLNTIGNGGSGMCYEGIPNSIAIEFDTWGHPFFGDPDSNHVSVQTQGTAPNTFTLAASLGLNGTIPELTSGAVFTARIEYVPGTLKVLLDGVEALSVSVNLDTLLSLDAGRAWVGFTSSTGGAWENHDLLSWTFTSAGACYPDCNGDGALNLADFGCFQTRFALNNPYADCNGDGVLNLADFGCFQTRFALGCP